MVLRAFRTALVLLGLLVLCGSAHAQFIGFTSPQTVIQRGILKNVSVAVLSAPVPNIGQSAHYLIYQTTGTITSLSLQIEGSIDCTNYVRITETATASPSGALFASGFFPCVRVALTAISGGGSLTADYVGTSVNSGTPVGIFAVGASNPLNVFGAPSGTNATYTILLPSTATANSLLYLTCSGALPAGATVSVTGGPSSSEQTPIVTNVPVCSSTSPQAVPVGTKTGGVLVLTYSAAPSTGTYNATVVSPAPAPSSSVGKRIGSPAVP